MKRVDGADDVVVTDVVAVVDELLDRPLDEFLLLLALDPAVPFGCM